MDNINDNIIKVQGVKLTPQVIKALSYLQDRCPDDNIAIDIDAISRFLIDISCDLTDEQQIKILPHLQMLNTIRDYINDISIVNT